MTDTAEQYRDCIHCDDVGFLDKAGFCMGCKKPFSLDAKELLAFRNSYESGRSNDLDCGVPYSDTPEWANNRIGRLLATIDDLSGRLYKLQGLANGREQALMQQQTYCPTCGALMMWIAGGAMQCPNCVINSTPASEDAG